jgi:hypothetical protein
MSGPKEEKVTEGWRKLHMKKILLENLKGRDHLEDLGIGWRYY